MPRNPSGRLTSNIVEVRFMLTILKRIGLPALVLLVMLTVCSAPASAGVRSGVYVGAPGYTYSYPYPVYHRYYYSTYPYYASPAYPTYTYTYRSYAYPRYYRVHRNHV